MLHGRPNRASSPILLFESSGREADRIRLSSPLGLKTSATQLDVFQKVGPPGRVTLLPAISPARSRSRTPFTRAAGHREFNRLRQGSQILVAFCSRRGSTRAIVAEEFQRRASLAARFSGIHQRTSAIAIIAAFKPANILRLASIWRWLTTGFQTRRASILIALLRPTKSAGLYVQMVGRGTRAGAGARKTALFWIFAGNVRRHGPI